jgi:hypothetical protein
MDSFLPCIFVKPFFELEITAQGIFLFNADLLRSADRPIGLGDPL